MRPVTLIFIFSVLVSAHRGDWRILTNENEKPYTYTGPDIESKYLADVEVLIKGGTNAEAYWSFDGTKISFQAIRDELGQRHPCDAIYVCNADGSNITLISTGKGRTTCSFFYPDGEHVIYSSTPDTPWCPPTPDMRYGYVWPLYQDMDIYLYNLKTGVRKQMTKNQGYNAESTISPDGKHIVFTSDRDGDLELYTMDLDGHNVRRMTYTPGYDGGAFYSFNSSLLVWRASRPSGEDLTTYLNLLKLGIVKPEHVQIYIQDAELRRPAVQITNNKGTNFAPFFLPDDSGVIFSSNLHDPEGGNFQLFLIKTDGTGLQQITTEGNFNSFPMFSPDGKYLLWGTDRDAKRRGEINIMKARWIGPGSRK